MHNNLASAAAAAAGVGTGSGFGCLGLLATQRQIVQWLCLNFIFAIVLLIHNVCLLAKTSRSYVPADSQLSDPSDRLIALTC
jgi:hypothetical protein